MSFYNGLASTGVLPYIGTHAGIIIAAALMLSLRKYMGEEGKKEALSIHCQVYF